MADIVIGSSGIAEIHVRDLNGAAVTGLTSGSFTASLKRRASGGTYAGASESLTFAESGSGTYTYTWAVASDAAGYVYWLQVTEGAFTLSAGQIHNLFFTVSDESQTYTANDAFCSLANVQAKMQRGNLSATSVPTDSQVTDFMAWRASDLEALLFEEGLSYTVPSGANPINTGTTDGRILANMLREANAAAAAVDAILAFEVRDTEVATRVAGAYLEEWTLCCARVRKYARNVLTTRSTVTASADIADDDTLHTPDSLVF